MRWLNAIIKTGFDLNMRRVQRGIEHPELAQEEVFKYLIKTAAATEFGKKYDFASIHNIETFQQRIPLQDYEDLKPLIERMMRGESDVLWAGKTTYFSRSSGTTANKSKFIPVSTENLKKCHLQGAHDAVSIWFHNNPHSRLFDASRAIIMGGEVSIFDSNAQTYCGDVSAIMLKHLPFYGVYFLTPDVPTALLADWETKIEKIAQVAVHQNISNLSGVPTWTLVLLRRILEISGKDNLSEVFPNFELYAHGGVNFEPYRSQFQDLFPKGIQYRNTYNASEGFFSSQFSEKDAGMQLLLNNGIFYEFIPLEEYENPFPKAITIDKVQKNIHYAMIISTNAGLWRYKIGDTVLFTSLYPHHIQVTGRTKQYINVFGEEVMVWNVEQAMANTCLATHAQVQDYTVAPIFLSENSKGGHEWAIEFKIPPSNLAEFQKLLDQNLQMLNSDYEAKRYKNIALQELQIQALPSGSFYHWLKHKGKYGGQNKVPRLSNDRTYIEELLAFVKSH